MGPRSELAMALPPDHPESTALTAWFARAAGNFNGGNHWTLRRCFMSRACDRRSSAPCTTRAAKRARALGSLAATLLIFASLVAAPASAADVEWSVAGDFRVAPDQANPSPDNFGNSGVWHYMQGSAFAPGPASYSYLNNFITDRFHVEGLQGWQGDTISQDEKDQLPHVSINSRDDNPMPFNIDWPPGTVLIHPLPDQTAIVGWKSPADGRVAIGGSFIDRHADCGDGFSWSVDHGSTSLSAGDVPSGGGESFGGTDSPLSDVHVAEGDFLYFIVGPGPSFDHACDSTGLEAAITLLCHDKDNNKDGLKDKCRKQERRPH